MTDLRPATNKGAVGWRIQASNPNGYRASSDEWATVLAVVTTETKREAFVVLFDDGATDLWVVDDPSNPYAWAPAPESPAPPRRFVVLAIDSERFEYRNRYLVIDLERTDGGAAVAAECDGLYEAQRVAVALELHPDPLPMDPEPF